MNSLDESTNKVKRILVVDDHILFREGLMSLFRSAPDFEVVAGAGNMYEGIEKARELHPDIILMDFSLPDGTGLDATEAILTWLPECKIVFLTVYETDEKMFAAIRAGAKGYMLKNISGADLIASLRALERGEMALTRKMMSKALDEFTRVPAPAAASAPLTRLSPREIEILCELESGATNTGIAQHLFISENTVKHHIGNVLDKLGLENRHQAALIARQHGMKSKFPPTSKNKP
jgi:DNA-binding NarL/FixJ family response regulator